MHTNPLAPSEAPALTPLRSQTTPPGRILVVEDDPYRCHLSADVLIQHGYEVNAADNSAAGWEELQANPYNLVITAGKKPRVAGVELLKKLHAARMALPVILAAGTPRKKELAQSPWLQPAAVLRPRYTFEELLATVKKVLHTTTHAAPEIPHLG